MPGNAWYAFANESLQLMLRRFEQEHPSTQVLSLAYSVWGEVGMGARLGSVKNLARMGINAIPTAEGVQRFLKLFTHDPGVKQVVIAARLNGLDTWTPLSFSTPTGLRFIEEVVYLESGVELAARTRLTLDRDLYVRDHLWRGSYLFPTVFGLEAMSQATAYVIGEQQPAIIRLEDISLRRPIVVNPDSGVEIEIHAEVMELDLKPKTDLYGDLLFQGARFQRMGDIFFLDRQKSVFRSFVAPETSISTESFAPNLGKCILLGDPYFRDVMLQSVQLTIPQHICLPVQIAKIELFANPSSAETSRIVHVELQQLEGQEYISEVIATNERGDVLERLSGYRLRILEEHAENPTASELVNPQERDRAKLEQVLAGAFQQFGLTPPIVGLGYLPDLQSKPKKQRRTLERPLISRTLKQRFGLAAEEKLSFQLKTLASGKPKLVGTATTGLDLSLFHCDRYCLCVVAETPQGCDIESIQSRQEDNWVGLLGSERKSLLEELIRQGDNLDRAGARIWSALEAVRKAFNGSQPKFTILAQAGDRVLLQCHTTNCVVNSSFDTYIEFCKMLPNNSLARIAIAEVQATWVRLVSYGIPSPRPFPDYLQQYLDRPS